MCFSVLPAGAVDVAGSSAAEASAAVLPGSAGHLYGAHPHLGLQAPPVRRAGRLRPRSPHCLLGGEYTEPAHYHRCACARQSPVKMLRLCLLPLRPSTSRPCLKARGRTWHPRTAWINPCHPTRLSARLSATPIPPPSFWERREMRRMSAHFL